MERTYLRLDEGYTRIVNSLLRAIYKYSFNGTEFKIVLAIIRRTYGWNKEKAVISYGYLASEVEVDMRNVRRAIKLLVRDKVILKEKCGRKNMLGINKEYASWSQWKTRKSRGENTPIKGVSLPLR